MYKKPTIKPVGKVSSAPLFIVGGLIVAVVGCGLVWRYGLPHIPIHMPSVPAQEASVIPKLQAAARSEPVQVPKPVDSSKVECVRVLEHFKAEDDYHKAKRVTYGASVVPDSEYLARTDEWVHGFLAVIGACENLRLESPYSEQLMYAQSLSDAYIHR